MRKVYFVGAGPGDPELLTLKAYKLLKKADLIIYPGSIIEGGFLKDFDGKKMNSYGRSLQEIIDSISEAVKEGEEVVRLQSGDPSIYGALDEQREMLNEKEIDIEVVPGVSSVFASASSLKMELTIPGVSQTVAITRPAGKTLSREEDIIEELAELPLTLVILLGIGELEDVVEKVSRHRGNVPIFVVYHASREDEKIIRGNTGDIVEKVRLEGIERTAVIIVGLRGEHKRSVLYEDSGHRI